MNLDAVFKAYDIRGTVPDQIDGDLCRRVGAAFARFAGAPAVVVGHDMRPSGVELVEAFLEGVTSQGVDAVELGLASTDLLYFASGRLDMPGAVLTASHNPAEYNGIKLCGPGAAPIGVDSGLGQIRADVEAGLEPAAAVGTRSSRDLLPDYVDHVRAFAAPDALSGLKVVADTANGMGGLVVPAVFAGLPVELDLLYGELDGTFPNHPADPIAAENLVDLQARVRETGADLGLAFDGDADRVFLVDERAEPISGSAVTAMVARGLLDRNPGATILYNLICSKAVPEIVAENGGTAVRTKVGHSYIKAMMAETGAVFGGEHSGHYYFRDNFRADSGLIASMVILEQLGRAGVPMSELRRPFERYPSSGEINSRVSDAPAVIEQVAARYSDLAQDRLDGLTVDGGDWWCNLRASNTEPLLRLNVEADDEALLAARRDELLSLIRGESR